MMLVATAVMFGVVGALAGAPEIDWPGTSPARTADRAGVLGVNISGLATDGADGLWAVRDGSSALLHLDRTAAEWSPTVGWGTGRALRYPDGSGDPDAEGVTAIVGDDSVVYVAAERDNDAPGRSRNSILRYDISGSGVLTASAEWRLDTVLPSTGANTGIEGVAWIPDRVFVEMDFRDAAGRGFDPGDYPDHGGGLFVVGLENSGDLVVVALGGGGEVSLVGLVPSGLPAVMDITWSEDRNELWVICDNTCDGRATVLRPSTATFDVAAIVRPPGAMASLNNEGFAFVPGCNDGNTTAVWSDDGATAGHALREATLSCTPALPGAVAASSSIAVSVVSTTSAAPPVSESPPTDGSTRVGWPVGLVVVVAVAAGVVVARSRRARTGSV